MNKFHIDLSILCNESYDHHETDIWSVRETDGLVRIKDNYIRIAYRGTSSRPDILRDLRIWPWRNEAGWLVHKGFGIGAEHWVYSYRLKLYEFKDLPIYITGHSLGAAIAVQASILLKAHGFNVVEVVTFGEPKSIYKGDFGSEIKATSYLNENDWIKFAPPWGNTCVPRTFLNPKWGISRKAHDIVAYTNALTTKLEN